MKVLEKYMTTNSGQSEYLIKTTLIGMVQRHDPSLIAILHKAITSEIPIPYQDNGHGECKKAQCCKCNSWTEKEDLYEHDGDSYCEVCEGEYFSCCEVCGEMFGRDDVTYIDIRGSRSGDYCDSCRDETFIQCYDCDKWVAVNDSYVSDRGRNYCSECYSERFTRCDSCGCEVSTADICCNDNGSYCSSCYDDQKSIHDYSFKPSPIFHGTGPRFTGWELEVIAKGSQEDAAKLITEKFEGLLYCKHDGSVSSGFEIVSHPCSYDYYMQEGIFEKLGEFTQLRSYKHSECGFHVHISKDSVSLLTLAKLIIFFANNIAFVEYIAQRSHNSYCKEECVNGAGLKAKNGNRDRYQAINITGQTIEFRIFKGNCSVPRLKKNLQFVYGILEYCEGSSILDLSVYEFIKYLKDTKYNELKKFCMNYDAVENL